MKFDDEHYEADGEPKKCYSCGAETFLEIVKGMVEYHVCEKSIICSECTKEVAYWSYGNFDSSYGYLDEDIEDK